jgi:autotransporter-associated beta strand protein
MKKTLPLSILLSAISSAAFADTTWISTSSTIFTTAGNWNNGLPSTGPQLGIFADGASIQHTIDIQGTTARNTVGIQFNSFTGGTGFTLKSTTANSPGFQIRAQTSGIGIINNDDSTQTFDVAVKLFTNAGGSGGGQIFNAAAGNIVFTGNNAAQVGTSAYTIDNNGGTLTNTGSFNITIGNAGATKGNIVGSGGLYKSGAGTLTLGGNLDNTYSGGTTIEQGKIVIAKNNAFGTGGLTLKGGTIEATGSFVQTLGTLSLKGDATIDFGNGATTFNLADSSALDWSTFTLNIENWSEGVDSLRIGTDSNGLTSDQLAQIKFVDLGNAPAQIDANGFVTVAPIPEPSTIALGLLGGASLLVLRRRNSK